jgi:hypothetical protein
MNVFSHIADEKHTKYSVVFDVGSASVGAAIIHHPSRKPAEIIYTVRSAIPMGRKNGEKDLTRTLTETVKKTGESVVSAFKNTRGHRGDFRVHAVIHPPWITSSTGRAEAALSQKTVVTKELLQQFAVRRLPMEKVPGVVQFDRHITSIELNGYNTEQPYEKLAEHVAMTMTASYMQEETYDALLKAFAGVFPNHTVHVDAFVLVATQAPELFKNNENAFAFIEIGGRHTAISVIKDRSAAGTLVTDFGVDNVVRAIAGSNSESDEAAKSLLGMYLANTTTPSQSRKVEQSLSAAETLWTKKFGDACKQLVDTQKRKIPATAYVLMDAKFALWFKKVIGKIDFAQFTVTARPFDVRVLGPQNMQNSVHFLGSAKRDSMLFFASLLAVDK